MPDSNDYALILKNERKKLLNVLRETRFSQLVVGLTHMQIVPYATYAPWEDDIEFNIIYNLISGSTLVDKYRCFELWSLVTQLRDCEADILEVGVWKGGTAALIARANEGGKGHLYVADTFNGVVKAGDNDTLYKGGEHADTSKKAVAKLFDDIGLYKYELLDGVFPDDFPNFSSDKIKLCHIDVDTFLSAKDIWNFIWPKIIKGGVVVFDDYGFFGCEGITKFVNKLSTNDARFVYNVNGHALLVKI